MRNKKVNELQRPICTLCHVKACAEEPGARQYPVFCATDKERESLEAIEQQYIAQPELRALAVASAQTEASGYMHRTRIEDIMDFARRIGASKIGIAHCIGLIEEARIAADIFMAGGFKVQSICCKVGSIPKKKVCLGE